MAASRNPNYTTDEDIHLCHSYLEITQDPIIGIHQKQSNFWDRVTEFYNSHKPAYSSMSDRTSRSIDSRMRIILSACSKFQGCIEQVELNNPSGASEHDIILRAKELMKIDPKYKKGFKFDHVWDILKHLKKFDCMPHKSRAERYSPQPGTPVSDSPTSPDELSPFNLNLSDGSGSGSGSASQRPEGVKKSKMKRKKSEDASGVMNSIKEINQNIQQLFAASSANKERDMDVQMRKIEAQNKATEARNRMADEYRRMTEAAREETDNKILLTDTDSISNPARRMYIEMEQAKILSKRQAQMNQSTPPNNTFDFGYYPDMGGSGSGSGSGLGDY